MEDRLGRVNVEDFVMERKASQPPMEPAETTGFWFKNTQHASSTLYMYFFANLTRTGSLHQGENPKQKQRGRPESTGRVACFADLHMPMIQRDDTQRFITLEQNVSVCVLHKNKYTSVHEYHPISQANVGAPVWGAALWARCRRLGIWSASTNAGSVIR